MILTSIGIPVISVLYAWCILGSIIINRVFVMLIFLEGSLHLTLSLLLSLVLLGAEDILSSRKSEKLRKYGKCLSYIFRGIVAGCILACIYYLLLLIPHFGLDVLAVACCAVLFVLFGLMIFSVKRDVEGEIIAKLNGIFSKKTVKIKIDGNTKEKIEGRLIRYSPKYIKILSKGGEEVIVPHEIIKVLKLKYGF